MSYKAVILTIKNVRPHPNADRVQLATCLGNQVVIGLNTKEGDRGIYFQSDGQLSPEFCSANNLFRDGEKNKNPKETGMFDDNGRVRAQKFRGEISDGFWCPVSNLSFIKGLKLDSLEENFEFDELNGIPICNKYINPNTVKAAQQNQGKKTKAAKSSIMFKEHFDTGHFGKSLHEIQDNEILVITEKVHGTSSRIGNVLVERNITWKDKIAKFIGAKIDLNEWKYLNGTRRVVLEETTGTQFHDPTIRQMALDLFKDNLRKGETVYLEIVGFEPSGAPIMPSVDTTKTNDKEFVKKYGKNMSYSYGCAVGKCDFYVYRITNTNVDGQSIDLCWNDTKSRCNELGVKYVPELKIFTLGDIRNIIEGEGGKFNDDREVRERLLKFVDELAQGPSLLDANHIKEGVCIKRDQYGFNPKVLKHKSFIFKLLEGIIKDSGVVDAEEAQG